MGRYLNIRLFDLSGQFAIKYEQAVVVITSDFINLSSLVKLSIIPVTKNEYSNKLKVQQKVKISIYINAFVLISDKIYKIIQKNIYYRF